MHRCRKRQYSFQRYTLIGLLALLLSSCASLADPETSQVHQNHIVYTLAANEIDWVGQSFLSRRAGLNSITIQTSLLSDDSTTPATLIAELYHSPEDVQPLFSTRLYARNGALRIGFPAQQDPPEQTYFLKLRANGQNVQIRGRGEDIYVDGIAYANGLPFQADLAFSTTYEYSVSTLVSDVVNAFPKSYLLLVSFTVLLLPGVFLLTLLLPVGQYDLGERIAISAGLSLASIPLLMLWTGLGGLSWEREPVLVGVLLLLIGTGLVSWRRKVWKYWRADYYDLALMVIFTASLVVRLVMIRDMAGTAWIDSVHHGLVTRLIIEQGSFPATFLPYFDISPTDYHPGYHASVAVFAWLSQLDHDKAMLLFGQVMNSMAVFSVYLFTKTLTQSKLAGVVAALAAGLCTPMPAYYTTWGRYTQLAGTIILPLPLIFFQKSQEDLSFSWRNLTAACVAAAGLVLVHYRVMAFLGILMAFYFLIYFLIDRSNWQYLRRASVSALACVVVVGLMVAPWLLPTFTETILPLVGEPVGEVQWFSDFSWRLLNTALGQMVMAFAAFGLISSLFLKQRFGFLIILWIGALFLLANPTKIGLPGPFLNNTSVAIFLFLPMSALAGYSIALVARTWQLFASNLYKPFILSLALAGLITGFIGTQRILPILNPGTLLLRQADLPALEWAGENLPPDATVAINPFLWGYGLYAGSDGGFWLTPLAGLRSMPPPVLSSMGSWKENSDLSKQIVELGQDSVGLANLLRAQGINYIYLGARGGAISPSALQADPQYQVLYNVRGVWIFQLADK